MTPLTWLRTDHVAHLTGRPTEVSTIDAVRSSDRSLIEALRTPFSANSTTPLSWPAYTEAVPARWWLTWAARKANTITAPDSRQYAS